MGKLMDEDRDKEQQAGDDGDHDALEKAPLRVSGLSSKEEDEVYGDQQEYGKPCVVDAHRDTEDGTNANAAVHAYLREEVYPYQLIR